MKTDGITLYYDAHGTLLMVVLEGDLWRKIGAEVEHLAAASSEKPAEEPVRPEPVADWESLLQFWDFKYPPDYDVTCEACGNSTENWREDEPRKFRLTAANLGGLVSFRCQQCRAKVIKRHFKKNIVSETLPFQNS